MRRRSDRGRCAFDILLYVIGAGTVLLSIQPTLNLLSENQAMNYSYNPFHLVNTYGAFGNVGRERYEIVMEGTSERVITPHTEWKEYGFKAKPGDPKRMPPQIAPYHLRLDWLIWFLPFSVAVTGDGIRVWGYSLWFLRFVQRLLSGDRGILRLMGKNPFPGQPPAFVRALFYRYRYTDRESRNAKPGAWWVSRAWIACSARWQTAKRLYFIFRLYSKMPDYRRSKIHTGFLHQRLKEDIECQVQLFAADSSRMML